LAGAGAASGAVTEVESEAGVEDWTELRAEVEVEDWAELEAEAEVEDWSGLEAEVEAATFQQEMKVVAAAEIVVERLVAATGTRLPRPQIEQVVAPVHTGVSGVLVERNRATVHAPFVSAAWMDKPLDQRIGTLGVGVWRHSRLHMLVNIPADRTFRHSTHPQVPATQCTLDGRVCLVPLGIVKLDSLGVLSRKLPKTWLTMRKCALATKKLTSSMPR